jgi:RHS repeat-associated protein
MDGFETGDFSAWSASLVDGGDLSVSTAAAITGTYGMQALLDDNNGIYVTDWSPFEETHYRARFYFDPNSMVMTSNDAHYLLYAYNRDNVLMSRVEFRYFSPSYQVRADLINDGTGWTSLPWVTISDDPHAIEIEWKAATAAGANDGGITLWVDDMQQGSLVNVDNDTRRVDYVQLGAVAGVDTGTRGTEYIDAFESRRESYIGMSGGDLLIPVPAPIILPTDMPPVTPTYTETPTATLTPTDTPIITETNPVTPSALAMQFDVPAAALDTIRETTLIMSDMTLSINDEITPIETSMPAGKHFLAAPVNPFLSVRQQAVFSSTSRTITYTYDSLYRLKRADYSDGTYFSYTYDAVGNRLTEQTTGGTSNTYVYDAANRLTSVDGIAYTWDNNGNLLSDGTNTYSYDHANRLIGVNRPTIAASYGYNGLGDRLQQTVNGVTATYAIDLAGSLTQVLADTTNTYLYGSSRIGQYAGTTAEYLLGDALGSVRQLADASGNVTLAKGYEPYGEVLGSAGNTTTAYGFTGERTDNNGLIYLRARYYNPTVGRFTTMDTWGGDINQPATINKYNYALSNPQLYTDPSGHNPLVALLLPSLIGAGAGFATGVLAGGIFGACTYDWAVAGQCGCEAQQHALSMTRWQWIGVHALGAGLVGGVAGAIAFAAPIGLIAVGVAGVAVSGWDIYRTYEIIKNEVGITPCTITRLLFDVVGMVFSGIGIAKGVQAWQASGSILKWALIDSGFVPPVNSKGVKYPDIEVAGYGRVPFPDTPYSPNNTYLRGQFTYTYKQQFKQWWADQGRPWPEGIVNIHHIKPLQFGGTNAFENLVPLSYNIHIEFTTWWQYFKP